MLARRNSVYPDKDELSWSVNSHVSYEDILMGFEIGFERNGSQTWPALRGSLGGLGESFNIAGGSSKDSGQLTARSRTFLPAGPTFAFKKSLEILTSDTVSLRLSRDCLVSLYWDQVVQCFCHFLPAHLVTCDLAIPNCQSRSRGSNVERC